ncbi:NAD-dependent protein deacetylase hst4 [Golovinomyces cichoracearum]|uniref:NAD-dependent protein deacetylase hst4 n=1 Tax=Golovinomyces cichoracearum TaxID=62708 RepID=A0A420IE57_9PEZI|nr:NAD-dependent protein deacetylase hst4 [Golovinomyces cichoracearum]
MSIYSSPLSSVPEAASSPLFSVDSGPQSSAACQLTIPMDYVSKPPVISGKRRPQAESVNQVPHAKRPKVTKPRNMKTEYLDLISLNQSNDKLLHETQDAKLKKLLEVFRTKRKIVVFAGAGISVSAGIPDFRSSTGLFKTLRSDYKLKASGKQLFDADVYRSNDATTSFHTMVRELSQKTKNVEPTLFHDMLATLAEEGRLMRLYTQNVDGIDTRLQPLATNVPLNVKGPWPKAIQLHGGLGKMVCSKCGYLADFEPSLFEGPTAPLCTACEESEGVREAAGLRSHGVGRLRPRILLYNEHNPDEDAIGAVSCADITKGPDAVIVVGTSLQVPGIRRLAREMCLKTRARKNGFTAWINCDPEPTGADVKDCWDMVVRAECDDIARIVGLPKWNDKECGDYSVLERKSSPALSIKCHVVVKPKLNLLQNQGIISLNDNSKRHASAVGSNNQSKEQDLKQTKIPFSSSIVLSEDKKKKLTKNKPGRKPLPSKPKNSAPKISNKFHTSKNSKSVGKCSK